MVYPFTQTAEPALAVGFIVYSHELPPSPPHGQMANYLYPKVVPATLDGGRWGARLAKCTSLDPRSINNFTWNASDRVYPCLPTWGKTYLGKLKPG
jgi:hypothetical protein